MGKCTTLNKTSSVLASEASTLASVLTLVNDIRAKLKGDYNVSYPGLAVGTTATDVASVAFDYTLSGIQYAKAAVAAGTAPGTDVIPQSKYGAIALDINAAGTISVAKAAANATGYASEALALAGIPALAAGKARMGTVSVIKSDAAFTFGTTDLDAANVTTEIENGETYLSAIGAVAA